MNEGWTEITLVPTAGGSVGSGTWRHPAQISQGIANAEVVELDAAPNFYSQVRIASVGGFIGFLTFTFSATGVSIASTHANDQSTIRVFGNVREPKWFAYQGG